VKKNKRATGNRQPATSEMALRRGAAADVATLSRL
jgi:hypothetical protein